MHFNLIVFDDDPYERSQPFYASRFNIYDDDKTLDYKWAYYDSLAQLRRDLPDAKDEDISIQRVYKEFDGWSFGGRFSGRLKVLDDQQGDVGGEPKQGYLDQTTVENLDIDNLDFIPDAYLIKGKCKDTFVRYGVEDENNSPRYNIEDWKRVIYSVPKDTLITLIDCHR